MLWQTKNTATGNDVGMVCTQENKPDCQQPCVATHIEHTHAHARTYVHTHAHTYTCTCTHMHDACRHTHTRTHTHLNGLDHTPVRDSFLVANIPPQSSDFNWTMSHVTCTHTNTSTHPRMHTQTHTYTHTRARARAHTHTRTHTHLNGLDHTPVRDSFLVANIDPHTSPVFRFQLDNELTSRAGC